MLQLILDGKLTIGSTTQTRQISIISKFDRIPNPPAGSTSSFEGRIA
jgi:hypothetical protein